MKQSLQLRLGQQLTMTPQLQQAIRLLQLSTLDLQLEIRQALESNLMLEAVEDDGIRYEERELLNGPNDNADHNATNKEESAGREAEPTREEAPERTETDADWGDVFDGTTSYSGRGSDDQRDPFENRGESGESLRDHLLWQAHMSPLSERDMAIAETIIDAVRDDGYLGSSLEDLCASLPADWDVEIDEIESVLHLIQRYDPVGSASRNPREALLVQLEQLPADTPWLSEAHLLVDHYLDLLVNRQFSQLARRLKLALDDLQPVLGLIKTLNPRPGSQVSDETPQYVIPDVYVRRHQGIWRVDLNLEATPRIQINSYYASLVRRADNSADNTTLRNHLQEARWFIKSLQSRNETLLKVARCIVARQEAFFEQGDEAMQPLVLREVAEETEMHESTISRITSQKYMHTPRGTYEFKYFFSSHVHTVDGEECSATAIRARIRRLIAGENAAKPLSDSKLAKLLREEGIDVARRTVAKYREAMSIPSSTDRKRFA